MDEIIDFWNKRPCNINHSNKEVGTKQYFEEVSKRKFFVEPHIVTFADFQKYKNKKVLEVGCGIGTTAHEFVRNGCDYTGIDISDKTLEIAQKRFDVFNLDGKLLCENIETYKNNFNKYDLIYSFGVLHHTPDMNKALTRITDLLKPNGELKIMLYSTNSWKKFCIDSNIDQYEAQSGVPIANTYTKTEVIELLNEKFKDIEITQTHIFQYKIEKYKKYEYEKENWFKAMPENLIKCLEDNLGWHLLVKCLKK